jgi:Arc/MetJ-type ribon-helix-helix transcriptional regulator
MGEAEPTVRLSVTVSKSIDDLLERLSKRTGSSKSEVLRKAIFLMEAAADAKDKGKLFGVTDAEGHLETRILVP